MTDASIDKPRSELGIILKGVAKNPLGLMGLIIVGIAVIQLFSKTATH